VSFSSTPRLLHPLCRLMLLRSSAPLLLCCSFTFEPSNGITVG
jgi:hypothetical protein